MKRSGKGAFMVRDLLAPSSAGFLAPKWLLLGCIVGLAGFVLVLAVVVSCQIESHQHGVALKECAEYRPFPSTVSELVHHWDSVSGRIFFGLELLAGLAIFMSTFAFCFENCACDCYVYLGPCGCANRFAHSIDLRWCDVRQFVPPMGLLLITLVPTLPANKVTSIHTGIMLAVHMVSAFMLFIGVAACEIHFWRRHVVTEVGDVPASPSSEVEDGASGEGSESPYSGRVRGWTDETDWSERLRTESDGKRLSVDDTPLSVGSADEEAGETTSLLRQDRTHYLMSWNEKVLRGAVNLCTVSCFLAFLGCNGLMYYSDCGAHRYFLRVSGRSTCESMRCEAVDTPSVCNDANALFLDHMYREFRKLPEVDTLGLPVGYPAETISAECGDDPDACVRDMPFGCFQRISPGSTSFVFNKDRANGVARLPKTSKHLHAVCACEMGGVAGPVDPRTLKRVHATALRRTARGRKRFERLHPQSQVDLALEVHLEDNQVPLLKDVAKRVSSVSVWGGLGSAQCQVYGIASFIFEVVAGLSVVSLHLCLWYFCDERRIHQSVRLNTAKHALRWGASAPVA